jgi:hypothetical protein
MALLAGSISVDAEGVATGNGMALAIFNGAMSGASEAQKKQVAAAMAPFCNGVAAAIVEHIVANAEVQVTITTADAALQRVGGTPTEAPAEDKILSGTLT